MTAPLLRRTVVVGAGPAGLLFVLLGRLRLGPTWDVRLFDKRASYVRTHRLRLARGPFEALARDLDHPRIHALLAFLAAERWSPPVDALETHLLASVVELGVRREVREVVRPEDVDAEVVVGADSVHSVVRGWAGGELTPLSGTHERLARLRVRGVVSERLSFLDRFRLAKVLESLVDLRSNPHGFVEIDLFLGDAEHRHLARLGATPKAPVRLGPQTLDPLRAPLAAGLVGHLLDQGASVELQSTFTLEHNVWSRVRFSIGDGPTRKEVFLVGDAAVSLPFFRGMACLAASADALARAFARGHPEDYEPAVRQIVARELRVVRARAAVIRLLRELVRLSALVPFPIQDWWLSVSRPKTPDAMRAGTWLALLLAGAATLATVGAAPDRGRPFAIAIALAFDVAGGAAYRWTLALEPGPHRFLRRVWELRLVAVLVVTSTLSALGRLPWASLLAFWIVGAAFAVGLVLYEWLVGRPLSRAELE